MYLALIDEPALFSLPTRFRSGLVKLQSALTVLGMYDSKTVRIDVLQVSASLGSLAVDSRRCDSLYAGL